MKIKIYEGMLPKEHFIGELGDTYDFPIPHKHELICIGNRVGGEDTVYEVITVLYDYSYYEPNENEEPEEEEPEEEPEIDIFVKRYDWESYSVMQDYFNCNI